MMVDVMRRAVSCVLLVCCSCATTLQKAATTTPHPFIEQDRWVEEQEFPEEPEEALVRGSFPISEGEVSPHDGVCLAESLAVEYREFRIGYGYLQDLYLSDRTVWTAHREAYETKIRMLDDEIESLEQSWWEKHDGPIMGAAGFVLGTVATIAVAFAVEGSTK